MDFIVTGLDTETTGLSQPDGHRIIEICLMPVKVTLDGKKRIAACKPLGVYNQRIHPMRAIDEKAQEVHGISLADLSGCPAWEDVVSKVESILKLTNALVIHNAAFDVPFLWGELQRAGREPPGHIDVFCTMENGRWASDIGKQPSLRELCWATGVDYDTSAAHAADYDVDVMMKAFFMAEKMGFVDMSFLSTFKASEAERGAA